MNKGPACILGLTCFLTALSAGDVGVKTPILVAMPQSMVTDIDDSEIDLLKEKFTSLLDEFAGLKGQLETAGDYQEVAKTLDAGKVHLGVFQGIEFAWIRDKHKDFEPLMIAIYEHTYVKTDLVVRKDAGIDSVAALKGKRIAVPKKSKEHIHLFLQKLVSKAGGKDAKSFFRVSSAASYEKALDDLSDKKVDAVIADKAALEFYARVKPGRYAEFKALETSEEFPPAVVVYKKGALSEGVLEQFKKGMLRANKSERGQHLMGTWNISSFELVPKDFQTKLAEIVKAYPERK